MGIKGKIVARCRKNCLSSLIAYLFSLIFSLHAMEQEHLGYQTEKYEIQMLFTFRDENHIGNCDL